MVPDQTSLQLGFSADQKKNQCHLVAVQWPPQLGRSQPSSDNQWPSVLTSLQQAQCKKKIQRPAGFQVGSRDPATLSTIPAHLHWDHSRDVMSHTAAILQLNAGSGPQSPSLHFLADSAGFLGLPNS